jgi:tripartite ATP-independent transporter DctM subunit
MAANCPFAFSMLLSSFVYVLVKDIPLTIMAERISSGLDSFPLVAIPFFILAARIMNSGGITKRMFDFCLAFIGHVKGGLAYVNVLASMIFAGVSGSAMADVAGLGLMEIQAMKEEGYDGGYIAAVTAATCTIGPVIPPSIIMIIIGVMTETSIGKLFIGGLVPGILMGLSMMALIYYHALRGKEKFPSPRRRATKVEIFKATKAAFFALLAPAIILASFFTGIVTPTEAGVIAVLYSIFIGFLYGELTWKDLFPVFKDGAMATGVVMFIIGAAQIFAWIVTTEQIAIMAFEFINKFTTQKWMILALINLFLLIMGCLMEGIAIILITVPVLLPVMRAINVDPVQFGVFLCVNVMIGLLTPPVGIAVYIASNQTGISVDEGFIKTTPFIVPLIIVLILITYIPDLVLFLPRLIFK